MSRPDISPPPPPSSSSSSMYTPSQSPYLHPKPSSPSAGERLLTLFIKFLVMCFALPLFFLFASVSAILLLHICLATYALRRHLSANPNNNDNNNSRGSGLVGLCEGDLKRMEWFRWPWPPDRSCAVCLEVVRQGESCRRLRACQHVFHKGCVDKWLVLSPNCPLCREAVRPDTWI